MVTWTDELSDRLVTQHRSRRSPKTDPVLVSSLHGIIAISFALGFLLAFFCCR